MRDREGLALVPVVGLERDERLEAKIDALLEMNGITAADLEQCMPAKYQDTR